MNPTNKLEVPEGLTAVLEAIAAVVRTKGEVGTPQGFQTDIRQIMRYSAVTATTLAGLPKCQIFSPHATIQIGFDSSNNLRFECLHPSMHCWDLNGNLGPC